VRREAARGGRCGNRTDSDPILFVAWQLYSREKPRGRSAGSFDAFYEVDRGKPDKFRRWKLLAGTLLEAVPRGLGPTHIRDLLHHDLPLKDEEARRIFEWFTDILPDMGWLVDVDDTFEIVREKLGCELGELREIVLDHDVETAEAALRNLISGQTESKVAFAKLRHICKSPYWRQRLAVDKGDEALFKDFFTRRTRSSVGRVGNGVYFSKAQMAEHVDFAEDVMKCVLLGLVAAGYDLLAFAGDEFVIQLRAADCSEARLEEIARTAERAAARPFSEPDFAPSCRIEIRATW
jgi:hypothetical protein